MGANDPCTFQRVSRSTVECWRLDLLGLAQKQRWKPTDLWATRVYLVTVFAILLIPSLYETERAKGSRATKRPLRCEHLGGTRASVPGHDGCPVGSLRLERQYRVWQASWRPVGTTH